MQDAEVQSALMNLRFHEDAIGDFLAYMDNMEAWCQSISKMADSRIRKVIDK